MKLKKRKIKYSAPTTLYLKNAQKRKNKFVFYVKFCILQP